jgi:ribosomal protein S18 acetylase RimI-like enzyme
MIITSIDETRVVEAAQYANRINQIKEHRCKACDVDYDKMLFRFRKMIKHPEDEILICTEDDRILGVLALLVERENKYLEAVGGVYAEGNYHEIAKEFYRYMKEKYTGFHFDAVYPKENEEAIHFMQSIGAKCVGVDLEMKLTKDVLQPSNGGKQVLQLSKEYHEAFCRLHDEHHPDVYWTGERLLGAMDKFDILIALDKGELVGSVVTSKNGSEREEVYFIETEERHRRQGYAKSLLEKSIDRVFQSGKKELMIFVEVNNIPAFNLYKSFGFQEADTCCTYSLESIERS